MEIMPQHGIGAFLRHRLARHFKWSYQERRQETKLSLWDILPFAAAAMPEAVKFRKYSSKTINLAPLAWQAKDNTTNSVAVDADGKRIIHDLMMRLEEAPHIPPPDF